MAVVAKALVEVQRILSGSPITCYALGKDGKGNMAYDDDGNDIGHFNLEIAVCPNNNEIHIYAESRRNRGWERTAVFNQVGQNA